MLHEAGINRHRMVRIDFIEQAVLCVVTQLIDLPDHRTYRFLESHDQFGVRDACSFSSRPHRSNICRYLKDI
ncbi:hypothetical protein TNCV_2547641 [Trichonephila clavipes]|nr:hypothetical protein TNCV_2547641 [Trichonephila clavipes]